MHSTRVLSLLVFAAGGSLALPPPVSAPATSLSADKTHQGTSDGISIVVPDLYLVFVGMFSAIPLMRNASILNQIPIPRAKTSEPWKKVSKIFSGT
jgi:hypothetical protein